MSTVREIMMPNSPHTPTNPISKKLQKYEHGFYNQIMIQTHLKILSGLPQNTQLKVLHMTLAVTYRNITAQEDERKTK